MANNENLKLNKSLETELIVSERILNQLADSIIITDLENNIVQWLGGSEQVFGFSSKEVIGKPASFLHIPKNPPTDNQLLDEIRKNSVFQGTILCKHKDGHHMLIKTTAQAILGLNQKPIYLISINQDVSNQKKLEKQRSQIFAQAIERTQMIKEMKEAIRTRDEFLSIASHELKTPLTPLTLQLQTLERLLKKGALENVPPERLAKMIHTSNNQIKRIAHLIDNLLDITRISSGKLNLHCEQADLTEIVQDILDRYDLEFSNCHIALNLSNSVIAYIDRIRMEQVVTNLLTNAVKYGAGKPIFIAVDRVGNQARLIFEDQGIGIAPENITRIFERFERIQSSEHIGGLGLGLYITKQIVEAHGGTISVRSRIHEGTHFEIHIPLERSTTYSQDPIAS